MKTSKARIIIVMDGGIIQHIMGDTENVEIAMIDYDVESVDEDRLTQIPQDDKGSQEQAYCWVQGSPDEINPARVNQLFDAINGENPGCAA